MTISVSVNHQGLFGIARDQMLRPTCLAFSTSDCHAAMRGAWIPLSIEYAFYHAQRRSGRSLTEGADIVGILSAIEHDGQPPETDWPYQVSLPADLSTWAPPIGIKTIFKRFGQQEKPLFDEVLRGLDEGRPVIVGMMLSGSFFRPDGNGIITLTPGEVPDPALRHAVLAVGYGTHNQEQFVLIRNSWGTTWGRNGYGWLSKTYLEPRLFMAATLTVDPNVSSN